MADPGLVVQPEDSRKVAGWKRMMSRAEGGAGEWMVGGGEGAGGEAKPSKKPRRGVSFGGEEVREYQVERGEGD